MGFVSKTIDKTAEKGLRGRISCHTARDTNGPDEATWSLSIADELQFLQSIHCIIDTAPHVIKGRVTARYRGIEVDACGVGEYQCYRPFNDLFLMQRVGHNEVSFSGTEMRDAQSGERIVDFFAQLGDAIFQALADGVASLEQCPETEALGCDCLGFPVVEEGDFSDQSCDPCLAAYNVGQVDLFV